MEHDLSRLRAFPFLESFLHWRLPFLPHLLPFLPALAPARTAFDRPRPRPASSCLSLSLVRSSLFPLLLVAFRLHPNHTD
jgi:hypothetical protein